MKKKTADFYENKYAKNLETFAFVVYLICLTVGSIVFVCALLVGIFDNNAAAYGVAGISLVGIVSGVVLKWVVTLFVRSFEYRKKSEEHLQRIEVILENISHKLNAENISASDSEIVADEKNEQ